MRKRMLPLAANWPNCLRCGVGLQGAQPGGQTTLAPGSSQSELLDKLDGAVSICAHCGNVAIFVVDGLNVKLRPLRGNERDEVLSEPDVQAGLELVRELRSMDVPVDADGLRRHIEEMHKIGYEPGTPYDVLLHWHTADHLVNGAGTTAGAHGHRP
jgi:hypothetical protein